MSHRAFVGLGSNLEDPCSQLHSALTEIAALAGTSLVACSSFYRSAPVGYTDQPDFVNAVAEIATELTPHDLLQSLLNIEYNHGRTRHFRNAPRTLDLDVLLYDEMRFHEHGLTIPHPQMHLRAFVLQPLLEIAPEIEIPGIGKAAIFALNCQDQVLEKL